MDSIMYTKEGEFEVTLRGGSPWGFTIRTQSGNGYNRGRVIVAKVVQGGKADSSGNIHVGDEILAVNGLQFDNEQQATEYVRVAKKELILKVKRGQDKRRMNIRLASGLPNYFTTALESPLEKNLYEKQTNMLTNNDNNKRSSKEYEKDIKYGVDSNTANALIDYQSGEQGQSTTELKRRSLRLTRSTTDLSESSPILGDKTKQDYISSSPPCKPYNTPPSPDKVQRVRIRSTNVTSPGHYKCSPESDQDNQKRSDSRSSNPGCSPNIQKTFNHGMTEELNRTWPSIASTDVSRQDVRLAHKGFSVSAARSQFEQLSCASLSDNNFAEKTGRSRSSSSSLAAPKPPSRNSSFRSISSRRSSSSSSSVFSDNGNAKSSEKKEASPSSARQESVFEKSRTLASDKDFNVVAPLRRGSSSDDSLDKPKPPLRFSRSKVLTSFRSNKKPAVPAPTSGQSIVHDRKKNLLEGLSENTAYHHDRTQSLPSSKIVAMHLTSKSWVADREHKSLDLSSEDYSPAQRLPRSSSFSRARVLETSSIKMVHRDDARFPTYASKNSVSNSRQGGTPVIQALRTGEVSSETTHQLDTKLRSNSTPFLQQVRNNKRLETKAEQSVPVLKENSIMQRLLMESQGQGEPATRSKAAAIKQEITQRSSYQTTSSTKQTSTIKTEKEPPLQQQRPVDQSHNNETVANLKLEDRDKTQDTSKMPSKNENETAVDDLKEIKTDVQNLKNVTESASKVDQCLDKLLVKLDSPPVKRPSPPVHVPKIIESPDLSDDEGFPDPPKEVLENEANFVENESQVENDVMNLESTAENPTSDLVISKNERNFEIVTPPPEIIVKADQLEEIFESSPPVFVKDDNDNISESVVSDKMDHEMDDKIDQSIDLKDDFSQQFQLSPIEASVKIMHSRENSASSLLEETLESAKTIASIYSVEGPTRSADGEDSISTASEMRRYSLAKRVVRKRPKVEHEVPTANKIETAGELNQSFVTPESIPLSEPSSSADGHEMSAVDECGHQSTGSFSSSGSRSGSDSMSPKLEVLEEQKDVLISSMKNKVELLKEQESEISEEMKQNDELGKRVASDVKAKITATAISKFELFVSELNNIIGLLLSLTQRMHRYEVMLQDIDLAEDNGREKRDVLLKQIDRVKQQYEEACTIKEINDKRGENVAKFVEESCSDEEFADFQHFVDMKTQLALTQAEIRDKIKLGEEKLNALTSAQIDWSSFDLSSR